MGHLFLSSGVGACSKTPLMHDACTVCLQAGINIMLLFHIGSKHTPQVSLDSSSFLGRLPRYWFFFPTVVGGGNRQPRLLGEGDRTAPRGGPGRQPASRKRGSRSRARPHNLASWAGQGGRRRISPCHKPAGRWGREEGSLVALAGSRPAPAEEIRRGLVGSSLYHIYLTS